MLPRSRPLEWHAKRWSCEHVLDTTLRVLRRLPRDVLAVDCGWQANASVNCPGPRLHEPVVALKQVDALPRHDQITLTAQAGVGDRGRGAVDPDPSRWKPELGLVESICHAQQGQGQPGKHQRKRKNRVQGAGSQRGQDQGQGSLAQRGCKRLPGLADPCRIGVGAVGPGPMPR